jgi:hypothetical protein
MAIMVIFLLDICQRWGKIQISFGTACLSQFSIRTLIKTTDNQDISPSGRPDLLALELQHGHRITSTALRG